MRSQRPKFRRTLHFFSHVYTRSARHPPFSPPNTASNITILHYTSICRCGRCSGRYRPTQWYTRRPHSHHPMAHKSYRSYGMHSMYTMYSMYNMYECMYVCTWCLILRTTYAPMCIYASICIHMHTYAFICIRHASVHTHMPPYDSITHQNYPINNTNCRGNVKINIYDLYMYIYIYTSIHIYIYTYISILQKTI